MISKKEKDLIMLGKYQTMLYINAFLIVMQLFLALALPGFLKLGMLSSVLFLTAMVCNLLLAKEIKKRYNLS